MKNLKKIVVTLSIVCLIVSTNSSFGQETPDSVKKRQNVFFGKLKYGLKVGSTFSRFSMDQPHTNIKPGLIAGVFVTYELSPILDLQVEPSYLQQGGNLITILDYPMFQVPDPPYLMEISDQKITYHNIDIPFLIKYKRNLFGLKIFAVAGPSISYNVRTLNQIDVSARSFELIPVYFDFQREENITSNIKQWQYGVTGGIGFETPVAKHSLIFDLRYRYSLNKTYPGFSYLGIYQIQGDLLTNSLYCSLGIRF